MTRLAEQISQNEQQAAVTQQALRNNRRVIRHRNDSEDKTEASSVAIQEPPNAPLMISPSAPVALPEHNATQTLTAPHSTITLSPLDLPAEQFKAGLDRRKQNRALLMDWLRTALVDGSDFGRIHVVGKSNCHFASTGRIKNCPEPSHWSKPVLFKSGAEKITGMLGVTVHYPSLPAYEAALLASVEVKTVLLRCELRDLQGRVIAEGVGARNLAQDYGDMNKSLKMAEKSAHIDATLRLAGLSEVFTQDLEDRPVVDVSQIEAEPLAEEASEGMKELQMKDYEDAIGRDEVAAVRDRIRSYGFTEKRVLAWLYKTTQGTVTKLEQLSVVQCASLLKKLEQWAEAEKTLASNASQTYI